jgi:hypothetical protein
MKNFLKIIGIGFTLVASTGLQAQLFTTDVIIQGRECVGLDCVNGESFGFDTVRLKENNLRIHFNDTSNSASFPATDWRIIINDSTNGGANFFGIEDSDAGRRPFTIEAAAPANALYVEADGDVGIKTANPVVDLHIVEGNTPTVRLEQDGSDGFSPQTWDMAGNEANFFIRDVTNGSALPFKIRPGAPTSAIDIDSDGDIRFGSSISSDFQVDVLQNSGTQAIRFATATGGVNFQLDGGNTGKFWNITAQSDAGGNFVINNNDGPGSVELTIKPNGNLIIEGSCIQFDTVACTASPGSFSCVTGTCP